MSGWKEDLKVLLLGFGALAGALFAGLIAVLVSIGLPVFLVAAAIKWVIS